MTKKRYKAATVRERYAETEQVVSTRVLKRRRGEEGYAVLLVFAMAATIAISLYLELPRAAFEAQRDKEQLLIDRGEAYSRAVQLYVRKFNRFPADFDALNNTQGIRFLRRQYADPMTGKDEWRVVHVGPGGVFTDSLVYGRKKQDDKNAPQTFITELQPVGGVAAGTGEGVNLATRRRASDTPGAPGDPSNPSQQNPSQPNPFQPNPSQFGAEPSFSGQPGVPGQPGQVNGQGQLNGPVQVLPDGRIVPVILGSQNGSVPGGTAFAGQPAGIPTAPVSGLPAQAFPQGFPTQPIPPGQPTFPGQGSIPGQGYAPPAAAANLINQLLTTPRPGGFPGQPGTAQTAVDQFGNPLPQSANGTVGGPGASPFQPIPQPNGQTGFGTPIQAGAQGTVIGGGIAGVASKREQEAIKVYNGRTDYKEWEFVYDLSKDKTRANGATPGVQSGAQNVPGQQPGNQTAAGQQQNVTQPNMPQLNVQQPGQTAPPLQPYPRIPPH